MVFTWLLERKRLKRTRSSIICSRAARAENFIKASWRSEEHTSELQSQFHLVCRLLLEKKKDNKTISRDARESARPLVAHDTRHIVYMHTGHVPLAITPHCYYPLGPRLEAAANQIHNRA